MRSGRSALALGASAVLILTALAPTVLGQDEANQGQDVHPAVGAWIGDPTPANPDDPMELYIFNPDGTMHGITNFGPAVGTWEATGERTLDLTFLVRLEGGVGLATGRGSSEVSEDGQSVTGTYTAEFPSGIGFPEGELGPGDFEAQRITLEPMGEPVGPFELPGADGAGASPAASPGASPGAAVPDTSPGASPAG